jgi:hypothetical protein
MTLPIASIVTLGMSLIEKVIPDKTKQAEAVQKLAELEQNGELAKLKAETDLMLGQQAINLKDSEHPSLFVAGWRPAVGWVCAMSLFMYYVPYALVAVILWANACLEAGQLLPRPDLEVADLIALLSGMLCLSFNRSFEKVKGVETKGLKWKQNGSNQ